MNLTKLIFAAALLVSCCISQSYSIKCFVCNSKESCKNSSLLECNQILGNASRNYLDRFHDGVNTTFTSNNYDCFMEKLNMTTYNSYYSGCIYSKISACSLGFKPNRLLKKHECKQCHKDGCNPAGRAIGDVMTVVTMFITAVVLRLVWK